MAVNDQYYTILTSYGKQKLAEAQASGTPVQLTEFAVGDGGGQYYAPNETQTSLVNEVYRAQINNITTDPNNPNWVIVEGVIPANVGGFTIREIGIFDNLGNLFAIGNYPETYKPVLQQGAGNDMYIRFIMEVENTASIQLNIDPAVVLASRKYVDDNLNAHNTDTTAHQDIRNEISNLQTNKAEKDLSNVLDSVVLSKLLNVDGQGSGLDADLIRGLPADFTSSKASSGYQKLPSGVIIQWGVSTHNSTETEDTVVFPIAFPNACVSVVGSHIGTGPAMVTILFNSITNTQFKARVFNDRGESANIHGANWPYYWIAIGY